MNPILLSTVNTKTFVPCLFGLIQLSHDIGRGWRAAKYHTITGCGVAKYRTITGGGGVFRLGQNHIA